MQIVFPKAGYSRAPSVSDSFAGNDSYGDSPRGESQMIADDESGHSSQQQPSQVAQVHPVTPPDFGLEQPQMTPRLLRSLMHRRVTKIASGGVHNICVVEPCPQTSVA